MEVFINLELLPMKLVNFSFPNFKIILKNKANSSFNEILTSSLSLLKTLINIYEAQYLL